VIDCTVVIKTKNIHFPIPEHFFPEIGDIQIINTQIRYHGKDDTVERVEKDGLNMALEQQVRERDSGTREQ